VNVEEGRMESAMFNKVSGIMRPAEEVIHEGDLKDAWKG
jgi:hypothetical protein